jgi:hypothetical protein
LLEIRGIVGICSGELRLEAGAAVSPSSAVSVAVRAGLTELDAACRGPEWAQKWPVEAGQPALAGENARVGKSCFWGGSAMQIVRLVLCLAVVLHFGLVQADEAAKSAAYEAAPVVQAVPAVDLTGTWTGTWCSGGNGHHGPMTAEFSAGCHGCYDVRFRGRFCAIIPFSYRTTLKATVNADGSVSLSGSRRLGLLMGTFSMQGTVSGDRLQANYCSKQDHGTFTLSRTATCCK